MAQNLAFKINKNRITIGEYCARKIFFGPGKLSGVSGNGPLVRDLVISDLEENDFVNISIALHHRPHIPVSGHDIPTQDGVDQWTHLQSTVTPRVDAEIGLLIASDVPEALDPLELSSANTTDPMTIGLVLVVNGSCADQCVKMLMYACQGETAV